ncbi:MAG: HEAT repeat domain-containing protein [Myxococcales bacterium]|nr:HEAT repeat domain-containing protein [Myxococcota bacterium]MDW8283148.1 HEAT repeat domain-containing protein [Myxococcales bacterium]
MHRWLLWAALLALPSPLRAEDWQVTRSPFDPRLVAQLQAELCAHPDDGATLRRLLSLYRRHRSPGHLQTELAERARSSGAPQDLLCAARVARELGQLDEAHTLLLQALDRLQTSRPGRPDRALVLLWLADLALARTPPDTSEGQRRLEEALSSLPAGDPRRPRLLRRLADLCRSEGNLACYEQRLQDLLALGGGAKDPLRRELAEVLGRAGKPKEAIAQWRQLASGLSGPARAEVELRIGEQQEADRDDLAALATYRAALQLLPRDHHLRLDLYERLVQVHRRRDDLPSLLHMLERQWPPGGRGFLEWQLLGRLYDECGQMDQAQAAYRAALLRNPHHIDTRRRLIAVLERSGQTDEVLRQYERLQQDAPGEPRHYLELAERLDRAGQRSRALGVLRRAAARFAGDPSLHSALADLYQRWGEADLALREAELLTRIDPGEEGHIVNLGELYWARGRRDKAEQVWKRLLAHPNRALGQARLADVYAEHAMMGPAVELYQKALQAEPHNLQIKRGLASAYERMNRPRDAAPLWEQIYLAAQGPLQHEARQHLSSLVAKDVRLRAHLATWQQRLRALLERPQSPPPDEVLALGLLCAEASARLGRLAEAEATLASLLGVLRDGPPRAEVLLQLVPLYRQQHKLAEAIAALKEVLSLRPDRQKEIYAQLAELSMQGYRDEEALSYAEQAVTDAQGELRLGELLERKDDVARAIAAYRRAIALDDRLLRAHMALARLHLRQGDLAQAAAMYREVAKKAPQEELVLEAGRKAIDLHEYLGTLPQLVRELTPLAHLYPQKAACRKLLLELYERYAMPLVAQARAGDAEARAELSRLGQSGLKPLSEALVEGDGAEQRVAVALLGELGNPAAAPALLQLAQGPARGGEAARPSAVFNVLAGGARPPVVGGPGSSSDIDLRVGALVQAARLADPRSAPVLARLSQAPERQIRLAAVYGLGRLGPRLGRSEAEAVLRALSDSSPEVAAMACLAAGEVLARWPGARNRLRAQLLQLIERGRRPDEGSEIQAAACVRAAGRLRELALVPLLIELLREGNEELERQAAWALGRIGDRRAALPLLRAVFLKQDPVREAAVAALLALGAERPPEEAPWPEPTPWQLDPRLLLAPLPPLPRAASLVWPAEAPAALREALLEALRGHRDLRLRTLLDLRGADGTVGLGPLEAEVRPEARAGLARALWPTLSELALGAVPSGGGARREVERDGTVRAAALAILAQISAGPAPPVPPEEADEVLARVALSDPAVAVRTAAAELLVRRASSRAPTVLAQLLASPDRQLRLVALRGAAAAGTPPLPPALLARALGDPDGYVRDEAQRLARR